MSETSIESGIDTEPEGVVVGEPGGEPFEEDTPEEAQARHDAVLGSSDEPAAEPAEDVSAEPAAAAEGGKKRAERTDLEGDTKGVTDDFVTGKFKLPEGKENLTPHAIAQEIGRRRGTKAPSTGAVSAVFVRWEKIGFAKIGTRPVRFLDYTDAAREKGLNALKEEAVAAAKAAKSGS